MIRKIIYGGYFFLALNSAVFAQSGEELKQAKIALQTQKYTEAIALLDKITTQAPNFATAHFLKGLAYSQINNSEKAISEYNLALRKDPAHSGLYFYRALAKEAKGDNQAALRDLETAILLNGTKAEYYYRAAKIYMKEKQFGEAKMNYHQAGVLAPDNQQILDDKDEALAQIPANLIDDDFMAHSRGVKAKSVALTSFEKRIKESTFASLEEGKILFEQINTDKTLTAGEKKFLLPQLRHKVVKEVYGNKELFREDIEDLQYTVQSEDWLLPEAMNFVFQLTANSPNWFSEIIDCDNGLMYRYQVTKGSAEKDYNMDIYMVRNEETTNIYNSNLRVSTDASGKTNIDIFLAQNKGYTWKILYGNYLRGTPNDTQLDYTEAGKMASMKTDALADCLAKNPQLIQPADASMVARMKALVQNLILNYSAQFDKVE